MVFLVTKKGLPENSVTHTVTVEEREWVNGAVKVTKVDIHFTVIHGVTVLKVPPKKKAWCSGLVTQAYLKLALFREDQPSILQV